MALSIPRQSFFWHDTDNAPPILIWVWHWLCHANPSFSMTRTIPHQSSFWVWHRQRKEHPSWPRELHDELNQLYPANRYLSMTLPIPCQSFYSYDTDYIPPILLLIWLRLCLLLLVIWVWNRLCPTNPYLSMTPTLPCQFLFGYDTDYAPPILI